MYDPSTGVSRGYGFVRFSEESDMQRALVLGQNAGSGLSLHGRTLRISEASGPNNPIDAQGRERSRERSEEDGLAPLMINGGAFGNYGQPEVSPTNAYTNGQNDYRQQAYPSPYAQTPLSPNSQQFAAPGYGGRGGPMSPAMGYAHPQQMHHQQHSNGQSHTTDPNNTTVFVGGLPACISEETLKVRISIRINRLVLIFKIVFLPSLWRDYLLQDSNWKRMWIRAICSTI